MFFSSVPTFYNKNTENVRERRDPSVRKCKIRMAQPKRLDQGISFPCNLNSNHTTDYVMKL